jgi:hypothetical protein
LVNDIFQINKCNAPQLKEWLQLKNNKVSAATFKPKLVESTLEYIKENLKFWNDLPMPDIKAEKKTTNKRKDPKQMEEDDKIWKPIIDYSRFKSYEKKGYYFSQSIITDGVSVGVPLRSKEDVKLRKKKRKKDKKG